MTCGSFDRLLETVHASAAFELLRAALSLNLYELLEAEALNVFEISERLHIEPTRVQILVEGLVAIGLLRKAPAEKFENCIAIAEIVSLGEIAVLKALVRFQSEIVAVGQRRYTESLISNRNEGLEFFPGRGQTLYNRLEFQPNLQKVFFDYMQTYTTYASRALIKAHNFSGYKKILDVGGGGGALASALVCASIGSEVTILDTNFARSSFDEQMLETSWPSSISFYLANMHEADFPCGYDLVIFSHQLVIWSPEQNIGLLEKAYRALLPGGTVIIFSSVTNDEGDGPLMTFLDSVYFQSVAAGYGQIYKFRDYRSWLTQSRFADISEFRLPTWTPHGVVIAKKS